MAQTRLGPLLALLALSAPLAAAAREPEERPGSLPAVSPPGAARGQGVRKLPVEKPAHPKVATPEPAASPKKAKGRPPARPSPTLPAGTPRPSPDDAVRRQVAGGNTSDDLRAGKQDPELETLREAERVLFPRPLPGMRAGWSWDLPGPGGTSPGQSTGLPPGPASNDSRAAAKDTEWLGRLAVPDLPLRYDERVLKYLRFYRDSPRGRAVARAWAKKSGRYRRALEGELSKAGLPSDLVWLSLIESGHNPTIVSPAGAVGLWQFMPETARSYGLTVDRWVDERMDPDRATEAASRFLSDLYRRFGSWDLAMAGYNMGYGGLSRSIKKFNSNDFWELSRHEAGVPWETALYVPKILATAVLMSNKKAFGIDDVESDPPESFDVVRVGPAVGLDDVARAAGVLPGTVERLNPQYLLGRTPPAPQGRPSPSYAVKLPPGSSGKVKNQLALGEGSGTFVVRLGDTPAAIARTTRTSEAALRSLNRIGANESLAQGTVLMLPPKSSSEPAKTDPPEVVVVSRDVTAPKGSSRLFYPVSFGDTLREIAAAFGVSPAELAAWNALDPNARLQDGMVLQIFAKSDFDRSRVNTLEEREVRVLVAGTPDFFDHFEGLNGKRRLFVKVRSGDTLASIGRRYSHSVGWMERINQRSRSDKLVAGETVVVYADRKRFPAPREEERVNVRAPEREPLASSGSATGEEASSEP